jgi:hypothetical protein
VRGGGLEPVPEGVLSRGIVRSGRDFGHLRAVEGEGDAPERGIAWSGCSSVARVVEDGRVADPVTEALERALGRWRATADAEVLHANLLAIAQLLAQRLER